MVSVIIPVYNGAEFLEDCLRSVMNQSYRDIEIIVIDDGSTDNSFSICERLAKEDRRIRLIQQTNSGVSAARNRGIQESGGEFITFVDADDIMVFDSIETLLKYKEDYDFVVGSFETFRYKWSSQTILPSKAYKLNEDIQAFLELDRYIVTPWGKLYRTEIIKKNALTFDERLAYGEDTVFNIEYCRHVNRAVTIRDVVYRYRLGGFAGSVKYHPRMNKMSYIRLNHYALYFEGQGGEAKEYFGRKLLCEIMGCAEHYLVNCRFEDSVQKMNETLTLFSEFFENEILNQADFDSLREFILQGDSKGLLCYVYKEKWKYILRKKIKKAYYSVFKRRI